MSDLRFMNQHYRIFCIAAHPKLYR